MPSSFFGNLQLIIVGIIVALVPILVMSIKNKEKNVIIVIAITIIVLLIISFFISIISDSSKPDSNNIENNNEQQSDEDEEDSSDPEPPSVIIPLSETPAVVAKPPTTERFVHLETVIVEFGEGKECVPGIVWIQIDNITTVNDGISFNGVVHGNIIIIGEENKRMNGVGTEFVHRTANYEVTITKIHTYSAEFVIKTRVF
ncbi:MAG: hypothetical protein FWD36_02110 [Treponema sp.]|nr:hypothetical protein [Treponema sp.]